MKCHSLGVLCLPKYLFASIQNERINFTDVDHCTLHIVSARQLKVIRLILVFP